MNWLDAALLGLVQGLTEFLPVSSTAHLLVAQKRLDVEQPGLQLEVATHLGTVLAVAVYYRRLFADLSREVVRGGPGRRTVLLVILATAMLAVVGAVYRAAPETKTWRDAEAGLAIVPWSLGGVGVFMLATGLVRRGSKEPSALSSAAMGLAQCAAAIFPGCSRSGSTIGTGLLCGLDPSQAARFSFLMSVPAVLAGAAKDALDGGLPTAAQWDELAVAAGVAFLSGVAAIHVLIRLVGRGHLWWFGIYCVALAFAVPALTG